MNYVEDSIFSWTIIKNNNTLVSIGPAEQRASMFDTVLSDNTYSSYVGDKTTWSVKLNNVNTSILSKYSSNVSKWNDLSNSCVGHTSKALWLAGVPNIYGFHPHVLNFNLLLRQIGISASPFLYQIKR